MSDNERMLRLLAHKMQPGTRDRLLLLQAAEELAELRMALIEAKRHG